MVVLHTQKMKPSKAKILDKKEFYELIKWFMAELFRSE